jgi:hypothetical protein
MNHTAEIPEDLFMAHGKEIEGIFREAVIQELLKHKKLGHPIASWLDGKVIIIPPEGIPVSDEAEEAGSGEGKQQKPG